MICDVARSGDRVVDLVNRGRREATGVELVHCVTEAPARTTHRDEMMWDTGAPCRSI